MKKKKEFFSGLFSLFIICIMLGLICGALIYYASCNAIIESHLNDGRDEPYSRELIYGEYSPTQNITLNLVKNKTPILQLEKNDKHLLITLTPFVFLIAHIIVLSIPLFIFVLLIYIFIEIGDEMSYLGKKSFDKHLEKKAAEEGAPINDLPDQLTELPKDISIYATILLRFDQSLSYFLKEEYKTYLNSINEKTTIDTLYEQFVDTSPAESLQVQKGNVYNTSFYSLLNKDNVDYMINSMLRDELYKNGYLETANKENPIISIIRTIFNNSIGHFLNWRKKSTTEQNPIKDSDQKTSSIKSLLALIAIVAIIALLLSKFLLLTAVLVSVLFILVNLPVPLQYTLKGNRLRSKLIDYERNCLSSKDPFSYTPEEELYMGILKHYHLN